MLTIYTVEDEANETNEVLYNVKSLRYKYISYRNTSVEEKLAVMYHNEKKKRKVRFKTLFNVQLKDNVMVMNKESYVLLE